MKSLRSSARARALRAAWSVLSLASLVAVGCSTRAPGRDPASCIAGARRCDPAGVSVCSESGEWHALATCDATAGEFCDADRGECVSPCRAAEDNASYVGCEYWPATVRNGQVATEIDFGVAVANPGRWPATVTVDRGGEQVATRTVAPGGLETIALPWVPELKGAFRDYPSVLARASAYRLRSNVPVVAYQFNPLEYRIDRDCENEHRLMLPTDDGQCFSFSNDASLLLPTHALTGNYTVLTWPSTVNRTRVMAGGDEAYGGTPGFFSVIGAEDRPVTVSVTFSAHVRASADGTIRAFSPGETGEFELGAGDVLQVLSEMPSICPEGSRTEPVRGGEISYCVMPPEYDLSGTRIAASGRVAVLAGHDCAMVPADKWACDHLEEQLVPMESWGREVAVSVTRPFGTEPNIVRIVSGRDDNAVRFEPASVHEPVTLSRGDVLELETRTDVRIVGSEALLVAQLTVGQSYDDRAAGGPEGAGGDPSLSFVTPVEQYRSEYTFLAPSTYDVSLVNVVAPDGVAVTIDGEPVMGLRPMGAGRLASAKLEISGGVHRMESTRPFGIVVYGFGAYTSYLYPGGLDLQRITVPF